MGLSATLMNIAINLTNNLGYWGIFLGMTLNMTGVELPSEVIMPLAGFAVFQGKMTLWGITLVAATAEVLGALIIYFIALKGGRPFLDKYGKYFLLTPSKLDRGDKWFEKYGNEAILIGRCIPIVRKLVTVVIYTFLGSLPYAFVLGYLGYILGPNWNIIESYSGIYDIIIYVGIIVVVGFVAYKIIRSSDVIKQLNVFKN